MQRPIEVATTSIHVKEPGVRSERPCQAVACHLIAFSYVSQAKHEDVTYTSTHAYQIECFVTVSGMLKTSSLHELYRLQLSG